MFGFAERGRLAMYESTLRQAKADAAGSSLFPTMALMTGMPALGDAGRMAAGRPGSFQFQDTLGQTIDAVPSSLLAAIDAILVRSIKPPGYGEDQSLYQMLTLINGLIFVRVVEVTRPSLAGRAQAFRFAALSFMEPLFAQGMQMMLSSMNDDPAPSPGETPKEKAAAALASLGIGLDANEDDDNQFCIKATMGLTRLVMERAGAKPRSFDDTDAFIGGLFAFTIADVVTQRLGGTFEIVSSVAAGFVVPVRNDPERMGSFVREIISAFNGRASASTVIAIGQTADALLKDPSDQRLARLVDLFNRSRQRVA